MTIFDSCFYPSFNTRLVKGNDEPIFLPAQQSDIGIVAQDYAQVVFAHGYYASALHEIAHWCLAGEKRRQQVDFGYWYCPDGRTAEQQQKFQQVEIKPQAIEWAFCVAAGFRFNVSCDNLSGDEYGNQPDHIAFQQAVLQQVESYLKTGFPARATSFINALADFYKSDAPKKREQFLTISRQPLESITQISRSSAA
ncbi:MAG: elongation factor P hydroxylase [Gammaproteobacteria bacterium]|nr:elongation factor P hydroxylase [Gammaproteobacteria bacterium]